MYKLANRLRLRIATNKGALGVEQLWDLSIAELDTLAVVLEKDYKKSKGKSFLAKKTVKDKRIKLAFDIALDILNTKVEEAEVMAAAAGVKVHNQKILSLIKKKKESDLENLTIEELEAQLK